MEFKPNNSLNNRRLRAWKYFDAQSANFMFTRNFSDINNMLEISFFQIYYTDI